VSHCANDWAIVIQTQIWIPNGIERRTWSENENESASRTLNGTWNVSPILILIQISWILPANWSVIGSRFPTVTQTLSGCWPEIRSLSLIRNWIRYDCEFENGTCDRGLLGRVSPHHLLPVYRRKHPRPSSPSRL